MRDLGLNRDGDLLIQMGDFTAKDSDYQHMVDIIQTHPGQFKMDLQNGVGVIRFLSAKSVRELRAKVQQQLKSNGYILQDFEVVENDGQFKIYFNGEYRG